MAARKRTPKRTTARKRAPEGAPPPKPGDAYTERMRDPANAYAFPDATRAWNLATRLLLMADWLSDPMLPAANRAALRKRLERVKRAYDDIDPSRLDSMRKVMVDALDWGCRQRHPVEAVRLYLENALGEDRCRKVTDSIIRQAVSMWPTRLRGRTRAVFELAGALGCAGRDPEHLRVQLAGLRRPRKA